MNPEANETPSPESVPTVPADAPAAAAQTAGKPKRRSPRKPNAEVSVTPPSPCCVRCSPTRTTAPTSPP
ncbi:MAG: 23S rRNA pseudouridylate synthase B, partial [Caldimonas sp.]